ncbi:MAG: hypothetical protein ABIP65_05610 [Vicinamibacterales bacterium]
MRYLRRAVILAAAALLCAATSATSDAAQPPSGSRAQREAELEQARFRAMDLDADGVITRREWRGNAQSFARHDTNSDGVLSGSEIWIGGRRTPEPDEAARPSDDGQRREELLETFYRGDRNDDGRLSRGEWWGDGETFARLDRNRDGFLTEPEYLAIDARARRTPEPDEAARPADDGRRRDELLETFYRADRNDDGRLSRAEWWGDAETFSRVDRNRDGLLTEQEYLGSALTIQQLAEAGDARRDTPAYKAGYERGLIEGRQAGTEDKTLRNQWDLGGQRELEQADSGYNAQFGPREDYQAGYRAGFRLAYRQGFGPR